MAIAEYGPEISTERGPVWAWFIDSQGVRYDFDRLGVFDPGTTMFDLHQCQEDECAMKPGAIYRKAVSHALHRND